MGDPGLSPDARSRIEALLGEPPVDARRPTGGYGATERWVVRLRSGRAVFAKIGTTPVSARTLRAEHAVYERLTLDCVPRTVAWEDHPEHPLLLLEDLSHCAWPPPWTGERVDAVLRALEAVHASRADLAPYEATHGDWGRGGWWERIAADPEPFLRLGLVTADWWRRAAAPLREAAGLVTPDGDAVCHFDLRSDNVCLCATRAIVVDWSHACLGNPAIDLGLFLPGLAAEGGPAPGELMPDAPAVAAWVAGFFAHYASKPPIPSAPRVREMQRVHLRAALAWASGELRL